MADNDKAQEASGLQWHCKEMELGPFRLASGQVLEDARLVWWQRGEVNAPKDNLVLLPTYYGGECAGVAPLGDLAALSDPSLCLLVPAMIGMGQSSSPSRSGGAQAGAAFPRISLEDNIHLQHRWLDSIWPAYRLRLVAGWSMGGIQALHWAALYPRRVERMASWCATSRCYGANRQFLDSLEAALRADPGLGEAGLRAFARVYAAWAYGPNFVERAQYRDLGLENYESLLAFWDEDHLGRDPHDLLVVLDAWRRTDLDAALGLAPGQALSRIKQPALLAGCNTDRYFLAADIRREAASLARGRYLELQSEWGHIAGGPGRVPACMDELDTALAWLMAQTP